jgi:hypothetical protein
VADDTPTHSPVRAHPAGVKTQDGGKQAKVQKLQPKETLMVNIGSTATGGKVLAPGRHGSAGGPGAYPPDAAGLHARGGEDRAQQEGRQALAPHRLGADQEVRACAVRVCVRVVSSA